MTEYQKTRYRKLLSNQKQGISVDFHQFQKDVEKENQERKAELQKTLSWIDQLSGTFYQVLKLTPAELEYLEARKSLSWLNETIGG